MFHNWNKLKFILLKDTKNEFTDYDSISGYFVNLTVNSSSGKLELCLWYKNNLKDK